MASGTLFNKVWAAHRVAQLEDGRDQLLVGLHLVHEVTSPQAFGMLREMGRKVAFPERTFATVDHIVPTKDRQRPFADSLAESMISHLEKNTDDSGVRLFDDQSGRQGVVHVVGPELGLTHPGMVVCCGDSHTSTHGAFGSIAFGIGTSSVRDVLATGTMAVAPLRVRRVVVNGELGAGVYAKDVILHLIRRLGVNGGTGFAYEFAGTTIAAMDMEARMTVCNMAIEGGARVGYINPDETTVEYLRGKEYAPGVADWDDACAYWLGVASDPGAIWDDEVVVDAAEIAPTVTWGINPGQAVAIDESLPMAAELPDAERGSQAEALVYMGFEPGRSLLGQPVDVAFLGSCTNGRISDFREAARLLRGHRVADGVRALAVPGSMAVARQAKDEGIDDALREAGFEWRQPGCSMCLAMNPDRLVGDQLAVSSSNRNFKGRQGSSTGRTVLMSPAMVAACAVRGQISDCREVFSG